MNPLARWSEPFGAHGGFHAHSAGQTLGRPDLDQHSLLFRESVQNSWDARKSGSISFRMDLVKLDAERRESLLGSILADPPGVLGIAALPDADELSLLVVTDRHTRGLGGPTRSDFATSGRKDFVGLVRNIGRSQDKQIGGGTYGFGKGILFDTSSVGTILIYTRTRYDGKLQSRFIAAGIGDDYQQGGKTYTGRHWWGRADADVGVEPYLDDEADLCADSLGINFLGGETGTSIAIVAPTTGGKDFGRDDLKKLSDAALEWAWPHMVGERGRPTIEFGFSHAGEDVQVVNPRAHPLYKHYAHAYELAVATDDKNVPETNAFLDNYPDLVARIWSVRPKMALGSIAVARFTPRGVDLDEGKLSKVALMRNPRFVVKYMAVEKDPSDLATAGVFIADSAVDGDFANTEPVAHDDWQPVSLGNRQRNVVRICLTRITKLFSERGASQVSDRPEERHLKGVAMLSATLGNVVSGLNGGGPKIQKVRPSRGGSAPKKKPTVHSASVESVDLNAVNGDVYAQFTVRLNVAESPLPVKFTAIPKVVLDGGGLSEVDGLLTWNENGDDEVSTGDHLIWEIPGEHLVTVAFRQPDQARLTLEMRSDVVKE